MEGKKEEVENHSVHLAELHVNEGVKKRQKESEHQPRKAAGSSCLI